MKTSVITVSDAALMRKYGPRAEKLIRGPCLIETQAGLLEAGFEPRVFTQTEDVAQPNQRRNALRALRWAAETTEGLLFCEDDLIIDAPDDLAAFVLLARAYPMHVTTMFLAHPMHQPREVAYTMQRHQAHPDGSTNPLPMEPHLAPVEHFHPEWSGTQCVYLPSFVVKDFLALEPTLRPGMPFDIALRDYVHQSGRPMLGAFPNPVQHARPLTLVDTSRKGQESPTYGWPTTRSPREIVREAFGNGDTHV